MRHRTETRKQGRAALLALIGILAVPFCSIAQVEVTGLTHLDGSAVEADAAYDNALFVVFSTWSPKCAGIVPKVNQIQADWGERARVFLVNFQEDAATVEGFLAGRSLDVEVLLDPDASFSKNHKITYLPSLLAVKDGSPAFRGKLPTDINPVLDPIFE